MSLAKANHPASSRIKKRIVVCCDGTWQDGVSEENRQSYTNILVGISLRTDPAIPQIVLYQSGIGSEKGWYSEYIVGTTGATLGDKVEEAYAFIAHNYVPGDEIFLFGFSRGAYTARMVAMFIGLIGVLDRTDMDSFASLFLACQKLGKTDDADEKLALQAQLDPWTQRDSPGKRRSESDGAFSVKFVGVFDTVGSVGLPEEITRRPGLKNIFGFNDRRLGEHVEFAYQALALNETRADFDCCKWEQTPLGVQRGQKLAQCWFTGSHADIGGGYEQHDLADITLFWMAANVADHLSLDYAYLSALPQPTCPYGQQPAHDPSKGIFALANKTQRKVPSTADTVTCETIHPSVLKQPAESITVQSHLIHQLLPLEIALEKQWPTLVTPVDASSPATPLAVLGKRATRQDTGLTTESGKRIHEPNWLGKMVHEITSSIQETIEVLQKD
ncbi:DUF2235 domain-containing protein [Mycena kentingensis (nom. inval.)]|nr:DUF2235 domain-containing protein [Mycena kentingensis (nom. inval.)]